MVSPKLTNADIKQFQALYSKHFNQVLTDDEARNELTMLVRQMEIIYQPITSNQFENYLTKHVDEDADYDETKVF